MSRALVIEDNEDNMELITFILEHHGYATTRVTNGEDGVRAALDGDADFVLLDIQLPDIDGYEVLRRIRAADGGAEVPIIAITSFAMAGDRERLLGAGCNGYIEKPIDPTTVMRQIEQVLEAVR